MTTDWCAICEKPLERLAHGAYRECCPGRRYWSTHAPLPADNLTQPRRARGSVTGVLVVIPWRPPVEATHVLLDLGTEVSTPTRSKRWTLRRWRSARRGARMAGRRMASLLLHYPSLPICAIAIVPVTTWHLLLAPNRKPTWRQLFVSVAGLPVESIEAIYLNGRPVDWRRVE